MKKAVIFDMDGVLVDNAEAHNHAFSLFCQRYGIALGEGGINHLFGMGNDDILSALFGRKIEGEELEALAQEKEQIYRESYFESIAPLAGLVDILKALKEQGIKIAVGSSGMMANVEFVLESCGIAQYFDAIANGDMVTKAKPDPEVFLLAAELLGVAPEECTVCEDSHAGIAAARAAGMKVVALATSHPRERLTDYDILIDDFTQITASEMAE